MRAIPRPPSDPKRPTAESEHAKAEAVLGTLIPYLAKNAKRHTPYMDRWAELTITHNTTVYACKIDGTMAGRREWYGNPKRLVEVIESAAPVGKPGVWFCKLVVMQ